MRFSLVSLLLFTVWVGAALGVWFRREAWVLEKYVAIEPNGKLALPVVAVPPEMKRSADGTRKVRCGFGPQEDGHTLPSSLIVSDVKTERDLYMNYCRPTLGVLIGSIFEDNDSISVTSLSMETSGIGRAYFRRRFPEWWWGHFYRPEVWAFALASIALLVRGIQALRRRRQARAV